MPRRRLERFRYERAVASRVIPQPTYGFSTGLISIASPYACSDQLPVPVFAAPVQGEDDACRHSNDAVTSPSAGRPLR